MKNLFLFSALMLLISGAFAQTPGTLDSTFNGNGRVFTIFPNSHASMGFAMAMLPGDRTLVAGSADDTVTSSSQQFAMVRYKNDGTVDPAFGNGGYVKTNIGSSSIAYAVTVQSDGRIILAGQSNNSKIAIARYDSTGTLDPAFGTGGIVTLAVGSTEDRALAICMQPDGKILLTGYSSDGSRYKVVVVRLLANGTPDYLFNSNGIVILPADPSGYSEGYAIALQPNGKILVGGEVNTGELGFVARFHPNGAIDTSFGNAGILTTAESGVSDPIMSMVYQDGGYILCAGWYLGAPLQISPDFGIIRYDTTGIPDSTFGVNGRALTDIAPAHGEIAGIAVQQNGQIVAAGSASGAGTAHFALARFDTDGTIDNAFGNNGQVETGGLGEMQWGYAIALQMDGKIVVAGRASNFYPVDNAGFAVARYHGTPTTWSVEQHTPQTVTTVYPNPAGDYITVNTPSERSLVDIMDIRGAVVTGNIQLAGSGRIALENIRAGMYLLRIRDMATGSTEFRKIIKN